MDLPHLTVSFFSATCDFENDLCTWTNTPLEDDFDWTIGQGSTPTQHTGPPTDHSKQTGDGTSVQQDDNYFSLPIQCSFLHIFLALLLK